MAPLDAAFSRCAIVANDIPTYREFWGDAALYFRTNDAGSLATILRNLDSDRALRQAYADRAFARARARFTAKRMIDDYLESLPQPRLRRFPRRLNPDSCSGHSRSRHEALASTGEFVRHRAAHVQKKVKSSKVALKCRRVMWVRRSRSSYSNSYTSP